VRTDITGSWPGSCCTTVAPRFATSATSGSGRCSATRFASNDEALPWLAAGVTLGTAPYVVLKVSWLAGGDLGYETRR
jgi:hypothetical protein